MAKRLFLLRHGETLSNIELIYQGIGNSPLSELGVKEAGQMAEALKNIPFSAVYSSHLDRSYETGRIVAEQHGLEVIKVPELSERNYGVYEGFTFEQIKNKYPKLYDTWLHHPTQAKIPGAETLEEFQDRTVKAAKKIVKRHKDETVCIVGHGGTNRCILFHYMNLELENFWRIRQDNCCVNIIEFERHPRVSLLNSTWFLGEKRVTRLAIY